MKLDGGLNSYQYVDGNPVGWVDPLGLKAMPGTDKQPTGDRKPEPKVRLPKTNGRWDGKPGESNWYSDLPDVNEITGGKPVPFINGRPDFSVWSKGNITFKKGVLDGSDKDFDEVYKYLQKAKELKNKTAAKKLLSDEKITPHHLDEVTIQLIPSKLHGNIPHAGSASDMRGAKK